MPRGVGAHGGDQLPREDGVVAALAQVEPDAEAVGEAAGALDEDALGVELAVHLAAYAARHRRLLAARGHPAQRRQAGLEEERRLVRVRVRVRVRARVRARVGVGVGVGAGVGMGLGLRLGSALGLGLGLGLGIGFGMA